MLEFLVLLPLLMVNLLSMTFQVSVDELTNGNDFKHRFDERVHPFYARMMEESENEIEGSKKGPVCDIQSIQRMNRLCSCTKPKKSCVPIQHHGVQAFILPQCANVDRCEGFCYPGRRCTPTALEEVKIPVILIDRFPLNDPQCTTVTVEKHLKCKCSCITMELECTLLQRYNPSKCKCECLDSARKEECKTLGKQWDETTCQCMCLPHLYQECSTGAVFDTQSCRCVRIDEFSGKRRRKPPV